MAASLVAPRLPHLSADEVKVDPNIVRFDPEIEPLVRLLEETPRERVVDAVIGEIHAGRSYRHLLAALLLAGIRNVQPRPSVGFKFHCVLVVYSAHQASMAAKDSQRWLPLLWAVDYFKRSQRSDEREGDWTMRAAPTDNLPSAAQALSRLDDALAQWDEMAADAAATVAAHAASSGQLLDTMARHAARDFRSIGHKSIYAAGAFRTLGVIGWQHGEPVMRSLAYAILNHEGDPNPANSDLEADRDGRQNWERVEQIPENWLAGQRDPAISQSLLHSLRASSPAEAAEEVVEMLGSGVSPSSIYDGLLLTAAELVTRQPAIVPLHAVTTSNAMHFLFRSVKDDRLRRWLLLQNASFLAHFRQSAEGRGELVARQLDELQPSEEDVDLEGVFGLVRRDRPTASRGVLHLLKQDDAAEQIVARAREFVFLKGNDSHDYKFSSAAIEDYYLMNPAWRGHYLAGCSYLLHGASEGTTDLAEKVMAATA